MNKVMPQIQHVVYLMMENRSLDNLLGWLYTGTTPQSFYPPSNTTPYDGLVQGRYSNPANSSSGLKNYPVEPIPSQYSNRSVPAYDPYEAMKEDAIWADWGGVMNQLFGNQHTIGSMPRTGQQAGMLGFLNDYYWPYMLEWQGLDILWTYTGDKGQAPCINLLAANFAVSDRWFSSVPTQTNPNRAYSICGTSLGREANANLLAVEKFDIPTLFNVLGGAGKSWGLYYEKVWLQEQCYTQYTFPQLGAAPNGEIATMDKFFSHAKNGTLPAFTYLEPKWGYGTEVYYAQGNDYHPPTLIGPGEAFLAQVFDALRKSPQWGNTLFVLTFDEHGGTYDHSSPPWGAINPDGINGTKWGFNFQLYGARVPTLLISPYIAQGTVFREPTGSPHPYDHTSFIKTMLLWAGVDPSTAGLGNRVPAAPTFDGVLSPTPVNTFHATQQELVNGKITTINLSELPSDSAVAGGGDTSGPQHLDDSLFEDIPFASVREIINQSKTMADILAGVHKFKQDPDAFEADIAAGRPPS